MESPILDTSSGKQSQVASGLPERHTVKGKPERYRAVVSISNIVARGGPKSTSKKVGIKNEKSWKAASQNNRESDVV
jgi:hypothetical protein